MVRGRAAERRARRQSDWRGRRRISDVVLPQRPQSQTARGAGRRWFEGNALRFRLRGRQGSVQFLARGMSYTKQYIDEATEILRRLDAAQIDAMLEMIVDLRRRGGRLFFLGVGGSAGNASHAVNDFRKIAGIESYAPTDNVSELTARVNDDGWDTAFANWLKISRLSGNDMVFVLSVGGGDLERNISPNLVRALEYSKQVGAKILGVVGRDGGYTARVADACVIVPTISAETVTPHAEAFQAVIWHLLVSHPELRAAAMKWESVR